MHWFQEMIEERNTIQRKWTRILGVDYLHLLFDDGADLYITPYGLPFARQLEPQNYWTDRDWFARHSHKLPGSGTLYRIRTKAVEGISREIVLKWNRMGQDIPGETEVSDIQGAKFNSPFEEFGLVMELKKSVRMGTTPVYTHKPLAIYVPRQFVESERIGRKSYWMKDLQEKHKEVALDPNRQYAVIYEWIKGTDAAQAWKERIIGESQVRALTNRSARELAEKGFRVRDNKPHHIIIRTCGPNGLANDRNGRALYALVDFELLERTPDHEKQVADLRRSGYLKKQARRFEAQIQFPSGLSPVDIFGVNYVYGQVESTGGALWVVGRDPELFEYFMPEKWRESPKENLSQHGRTYDTRTKDNVHIVCRVSRVGHIPEVDRLDRDGVRKVMLGYNSPFEEIAMSFHLQKCGIQTVYPRAIYMSGHQVDSEGAQADMRRFRYHEHLTTPEEHPILSPRHRYVTIWGYWNGPDEYLAEKDEDYYKSIDAFRAYSQGLIDKKTHDCIVEEVYERLMENGIEGLNLKGSHLLLSIDKSGKMALDEKNLPAARICNLELMHSSDVGARCSLRKV